MMRFREGSRGFTKTGSGHTQRRLSIMGGRGGSRSYLANMRSHDAYNPCHDRFYPSCVTSKIPECDMAACIHSTRDVSRIESDGGKWRTLGEVAGGSTPMLRARDGGAQLYELVVRKTPSLSQSLEPV